MTNYWFLKRWLASVGPKSKSGSRKDKLEEAGGIDSGLDWTAGLEVMGSSLNLDIFK